MRDYVVVSDSTCDLNAQIVKDNNLYILPLTTIIERVEYSYKFDDASLSTKDFYNKMRHGVSPTTAQVNILDAENFFKKLLNQGMDILYVAFSSGLSGTYSSACIAKQNLEEIYPDRKIIVIDSLCACAGEGILALKACSNRDKGMTLEENARFLEEYKFRISHWFTVETVEYLRRGGRLSNGKAMMAKMFGIKPVLNVDNDGKLQGVSTVHGRNQSITALVKNSVESASKTEEFVTIVSHADCYLEALKVKDELEIAYADNNIKSEILVTEIGPVVGAHAGPGTMAIFTVGSGRNK